MCLSVRFNRIIERPNEAIHEVLAATHDCSGRDGRRRPAIVGGGFRHDLGGRGRYVRTAGTLASRGDSHAKKISRMYVQIFGDSTVRAREQFGRF